MIPDGNTIYVITPPGRAWATLTSKKEYAEQMRAKGAEVRAFVEQNPAEEAPAPVEQEPHRPCAWMDSWAAIGACVLIALWCVWARSEGLL
jgi:hypothetical protein